MSGRFSYGECDDWLAAGRWMGAVKSAINGKRGQAALRALEAALVALPTKRLISGRIVKDGDVCALGALELFDLQQANDLTFTGAMELMDVTYEHDDDCDGGDDCAYDCQSLEEEFSEDIAAAHMANALMITIVDANDNLTYGTPEHGYEQMLRWVRHRIKKTPEQVIEA